MRPTERINNFLNKINWDKLWIRWNLPNQIDLSVSMKDITKYWKENPDQRIGQVLINLNIVPDDLFIWNDEETEILQSQGLPPEEYLFWGSIYDKDMNLNLPLTYKLIKDLDSSHISAIYQHMFKNNKELSSIYRTAFRNTLANRPGEEYRIETNKLIEDFWDLPKISEETTTENNIKFE